MLRRAGEDACGPSIPSIWLLVLIVVLSFQIVAAQPKASFDVLHYSITLEPDIPTKTVKGSVAIRFTSNVDNLTSVEFNCGDLEIDSVKQGRTSREFVVKEH